MRVSFPPIIHLSQVGQTEFKHPLLHIFHTGEIGDAGEKRKKKREAFDTV